VRKIYGHRSCFFSGMVPLPAWSSPSPTIMEYGRSDSSGKCFASSFSLAIKTPRNFSRGRTRGRLEISQIFWRKDFRGTSISSF
jgi:hypothetical protein